MRNSSIASTDTRLFVPPEALSAGSAPLAVSTIAM
jgi:hypothetical protein